MLRVTVRGLASFWASFYVPPKLFSNACQGRDRRRVGVCVCPCKGLKEGCWVACVRVKGHSAAHPPSSPLPLVLPPLTFGEASEGYVCPGGTGGGVSLRDGSK